VRRLVIDATIAAKWYLPEFDSTLAERLFEVNAEFHAPILLETEFASIFWKHSVAQTTSINVWRIAQAQLNRAIPNWHSDVQLHDHALELAIVHKHHIFDCIYLALAIKIDGIVITADKQFLARFEKSTHAKRVIAINDCVGLF
jgi:predicted nucleic acid-binding protein